MMVRPTRRGDDVAVREALALAELVALLGVPAGSIRSIEAKALRKLYARAHGAEGSRLRELVGVSDRCR